MNTPIQNSIVRIDGRTPTQVRPINLQYNVLGYASSSVLFEIGCTKVLVSITLTPGVPHFLKGQQVGWLSSEYAMLPCATQQRTARESSLNQRNSRNVEISRLIGRSLRATVDLNLLREKTITIDCDVLQADGGTRVACITAASLALECATKEWHARGITEKNIFKESIAAISAGLVRGVPYLDLSYEEDSNADADVNFVLTKSGKLIEVQGTAELAPIAWEDFEILRIMAVSGIATIFEICSRIIPTYIPASAPLDLKNEHNAEKNHKLSGQSQASQKSSLFSLGNRISK